ncbi:hypothetical protein OUHCRE2_26950 [Enterobacter asburiae]|jgi:hypothetical protein|uniref:hypothetical protein n=1 Tax=Enterobacter asburiae TaxID=61645 RepID=UPI0005372332|nr:hypothetical protein [Enterobacter asburiae]AVG37638.1 hypothetical protein MC67_24110 [Enterobacter cloacae complex sp.]KLG10124.1 hypothetical protein YA47_12270 [Enterobacter asburiae]KLP66395.1 hypothetical protein ABF83_11515 [Enterobacter asburiae]KUQ24361.1 hypothetical protein AWI12_17585 [Enterobacter asburiae]GJK32880.1 hypothetical protein TUM17556_47990 [Enterobacter asburiae]
MSLHPFLNPVFASLRKCWRGSMLLMHLHQKRSVKRAGEAGIALRARRDNSIYFARLCASW